MAYKISAIASFVIVLPTLIKRNLSYCSRDARKPIAVLFRKLSVYLQPFRRDFYADTAL